MVGFQPIYKTGRVNRLSFPSVWFYTLQVRQFETIQQMMVVSDQIKGNFCNCKEFAIFLFAIANPFTCKWICMQLNILLKYSLFN